MALLSVSCLSKAFPSSDGRPTLPVVNGLSFEIEKGEMFALLGPSGCGKTTTLRCIAGLARPDRGTIALGNQILNADDGTVVPPERRGIGLVFQDYALFPHLTVQQHVAFGLRQLGREHRQARVQEVIRLVGLVGLEERFPHALSGGQQQRVALARAIAPRPRLLLLDEPFSSLDAGLRHETRERVRELIRAEKMTALLVTHDQQEALAFSDRVAVMQSGQIDQLGTPQQVYSRPRTLFVAQFLGRTNLMLADADGDLAKTPFGTLQLSRPASGTIMISLRPEALELRAGDDPREKGDEEAIVLSRDYWGHDVTYRVQLPGVGHGPVECLVHGDAYALFDPGDTVRVRVVAPAVVLERVGEPAT
ncbi:MAG: ABC transporter ATP-binding protein [Bacteroidota bacterium]